MNLELHALASSLLRSQPRQPHVFATLSPYADPPAYPKTCWREFGPKNAIRKAAEAEAQRRGQVEREGLLRQIRVQGARLEEANINHQELLAKNNGLQVGTERNPISFITLSALLQAFGFHS